MPDANATGQVKVGISQGATELWADNGGTVNFTSGKVLLPGSLMKGYRELSIFDARALSSAEAIGGVTVTASTPLANAIGGLLNAGSTPTLTMNSTVNQQAVLTWASGVNTAIAFPPISVPRDFDSSQSLTLNAIAERASDNASNNVLQFRFWNGSNATDCGTSGTTMTTTPAQYSITVSASALSAYPGVWNTQILPQTHTNNAVKVYNAWLEYNKRTS